MDELERLVINFFPRQWTHPTQVNWLSFMFKLKLAGVNWTTQEQVAKLLAALEERGVIERDPRNCIRLHPNYHVTS